MGQQAVLEPQAVACPWHSASTPESSPVVGADEVLVIPRHRRLFASYLKDAAGATVLCLNFGEQEIVFDEPELFAFGEGLAANPRFEAADAARWGGGCPWPRVRELIGQLIDAGLVRRAADAEPEAPRGAVVVDSPLPAADSTEARCWRDAAHITMQLLGRALDPGHLELVVPVYRVAHPVLDAEARQVGEANVFPAPLRLDVATEWRICQHAGSRYQDELPMNVTALRSMVRHWKPAMALLRRLRAAYLDRFPQARRTWTVGHMQRFTTVVLALPAWLTMKADRPVGNGELDPVISSLFRVTDGVRMVMHRMLFTAENEVSLDAGTPIDAETVYAYAERNTAFLSDHGVCAGPKMMIEEFLRVLFEGGVVDGAPDGAPDVAVTGQVAHALDELDAVFDYGLLGLQAYASAFALWPHMARAYESLAAAFDAAVEPPPAIARLQAPVRRAVAYLQSATRLRNEGRRQVLEAAYEDMFVECGRGLGSAGEAGTLAERLTARVPGIDLGGLLPPPWKAIVEAYLANEQRVVRGAEAVQQRINTLLGRAAPARALEARDLALHYRLVAFHYRAEELHDTGGRLPYLGDDLEQALGISLRVRGGDIDFTRDGR